MSSTMLSSGTVETWPTMHWQPKDIHFNSKKTGAHVCGATRRGFSYDFVLCRKKCPFSIQPKIQAGTAFTGIRGTGACISQLFVRSPWSRSVWRDPPSSMALQNQDKHQPREPDATGECQPTLLGGNTLLFPRPARFLVLSICLGCHAPQGTISKTAFPSLAKGSKTKILKNTEALFKPLSFLFCCLFFFLFLFYKVEHKACGKGEPQLGAGRGENSFFFF